MSVPGCEDGGSIITNWQRQPLVQLSEHAVWFWTASAFSRRPHGRAEAAACGFNNDYAFAVLAPGGKSGESKRLDATVGGTRLRSGQPPESRSIRRLSAGVALRWAEADLLRRHGHRGYVGRHDRPRPQLQHDGGLLRRAVVHRLQHRHRSRALTSLNSFKYTSGKFTKYMFGPYFGSYTQTTWNAAKTATSDPPSPSEGRAAAARVVVTSDARPARRSHATRRGHRAAVLRRRPSAETQHYGPPHLQWPRWIW